MECGSVTILLPWSRLLAQGHWHRMTRSLRSPSISTTIVWILSSAAYVLPKVFFKEVFVKPISHSQKPPNQGVSFGINLHSVPFHARAFDNSAD